MSTDQSIGLMDGAYFVGRREIMDWINETCDLGLTKIEQTCTGAVACQLLDSIFPGKVPMSKVDWTANVDYQYISNYKILQKCFTRLGIERHIEVDRLIRGKAQDNLEFMQWFKRFHELKSSGESYDGVTSRAKGKGGNDYTNKYKKGPGSGSSSSSSAASGAATRKKANPVARTTTKPAASRTTTNTRRAVSPASNPEQTQQIEELKTQNEELANENGELRATVAGLEKERDFYFTKLRDVEIFLQSIENNEENEIAQKIFKILYATEEEADDDDNDTGLGAVAPEETAGGDRKTTPDAHSEPVHEEY